MLKGPGKKTRTLQGQNHHKTLNLWFEAKWPSLQNPTYMFEEKIGRLTPSLLGHWWVSLPGQVVCCNRQPCEGPRFNRIWSWVDICISFQIQPCMYEYWSSACTARSSFFFLADSKSARSCATLSWISWSHKIDMNMVWYTNYELFLQNGKTLYFGITGHPTRTYSCSLKLNVCGHVLHRLELLFLLIKNSHHLQTTSKSHHASEWFVILSSFLLQSLLCKISFACDSVSIQPTPQRLAFASSSWAPARAFIIATLHQPNKQQTNRTKHVYVHICPMYHAPSPFSSMDEKCKFGEQTRALSTGGPFEELRALDHAGYQVFYVCLNWMPASFLGPTTFATAS